MGFRDRLALKLGESGGRRTVFLAIIAMVLYTSFYPPTGMGIIFAFVLVMSVNIIQRGGLAGLGLSFPPDFRKTLLWGAVWGVAFQCFDVLFLTPGVEQLTQMDTDYSQFANIEGNLPVLGAWLAFVWLIVVVVEEVVFRRYIFEEIATRLNDRATLPVLSIIVATLFFGLAHWYQGISGVISTAVIGGFMLVLYVKSGRNLWMPMIAHGTINTIGLVFFYFGLFHIDDLIWGLSHITER